MEGATQIQVRAFANEPNSQSQDPGSPDFHPKIHGLRSLVFVKNVHLGASELNNCLDSNIHHEKQVTRGNCCFFSKALIFGRVHVVLFFFWGGGSVTSFSHNQDHEPVLSNLSRQQGYLTGILILCSVAIHSMYKSGGIRYMIFGWWGRVGSLFACLVMFGYVWLIVSLVGFMKSRIFLSKMQ